MSDLPLRLWMGEDEWVAAMKGMWYKVYLTADIMKPRVEELSFTDSANGWVIVLLLRLSLSG